MVEDFWQSHAGRVKTCMGVKYMTKTIKYVFVSNFSDMGLNWEFLQTNN